MVAVTVGYEHIVYVAKVDAQPLCITDKNVACSSIEQYLVPLRLQKDSQTMLRLKHAVVSPIIR